ncbi:hypothetical protein PR048_017262, partial [Dryococelus australis]
MSKQRADIGRLEPGRCAFPTSASFEGRVQFKYEKIKRRGRGIETVGPIECAFCRWRRKLKEKQTQGSFMDLKIQQRQWLKNTVKKVKEILKYIFTPKQIDRIIYKNKQWIWWEYEGIAAYVTLRSRSRRAYVFMQKNVRMPLPEESPENGNSRFILILTKTLPWTYLLFEIIKVTENGGFKVDVIVSDMGNGNRSLWKNLSISQEIFFPPSSAHVSREVRVFAGIPHLLTLLRNYFLDHGIRLPSRTEIFKWDVKRILNDKELSLTPKLDRNVHINVTGSTRQNGNTLQSCFITIRRLYSAKYIYKNLKYHSSIDLTDQWFDVMNHRFVNDPRKLWHGAFGLNVDKQRTILDKMKQLIFNMRVVETAEENEGEEYDIQFTNTTNKSDEDEVLSYIVGSGIEALSRGGLTIPTQALVDMANVAEKMFDSHHGLDLSKESGVLKNFVARLKKKKIPVPTDFEEAIEPCSHSSGVGWPTLSRRVTGSHPGAAHVADLQFARHTGNLSASRYHWSVVNVEYYNKPTTWRPGLVAEALRIFQRRGRWEWDGPARPRSRSEGAIRATLTRTPGGSSLLRARRAVLPSTRIREDPGSIPGFPWFSDITPGECWDGSLTKAMVVSFPILTQPLYPVQLAPSLLTALSTRQTLSTGQQSGTNLPNNAPIYLGQRHTGRIVLSRQAIAERRSQRWVYPIVDNRLPETASGTMINMGTFLSVCHYSSV